MISYKKRFLVPAILVLVATTLIIEAHSVSFGLKVQTDKTVYGLGETVLITVDLVTEADVTLYIQEPFAANEKTIDLGHLLPGKGAARTKYFIGNFANAAGTYTVKAKASSALTSEWALATFRVEAGGPPPPPTDAWSFNVDPTVVTVSPGGVAQFNVYVYGSGQRIRLSVAQSFVYSFSPNDERAPYTAILRIQVDSGKLPGSYGVTVIGSNLGDPAQQYSRTVQLVVGGGDGGGGGTFDFSLQLSPTVVTVKAGQTGNCQILLTYSSPAYYGTPINIQIAGLPQGATYQLSETGALMIMTSLTTPPGSYVFTVVGYAQGVTRQASGTLVVTSAAATTSTATTASATTTTSAATTTSSVQSKDFRVDVSPPSLTVIQGQLATFSVKVVGLNGFDSSVSLSAAGYPAGGSGVFSSPSGTPDFSSTLTVILPSNVQTGSFTLKITGSGGGLNREANIVLVVNPATTQAQTQTQTSSTPTQTQTQTQTVTVNTGGGFDFSKLFPCVIATATYGSELAPEVQFLREFRDGKIMRTFAGSSFMVVFNAWYYSFSPTVAQHVATHQAAKYAMRVSLYPLLGVLHLSSTAYSLLAFSPELAALIAGIIASSLLGLIYLALPTSAIFWLLRRRITRTTQARACEYFAGSVSLLVPSYVVSEAFTLTGPMMFITAGIVLTFLAAGTVIPALGIVEATKRKP